LRQSLEPGDVLLVEGNSHISASLNTCAIDVVARRPLCWSHRGANTPRGEPHVLIEAEIGEGVVSSPLSKYYPYHTRICRPGGWSQEDCETV